MAKRPAAREFVDKQWILSNPLAHHPNRGTMVKPSTAFYRALTDTAIRREQGASILFSAQAEAALKAKFLQQ